ncbi:MAG: hypothetical protein IJ658_01835 [Kiritimatiellae bacterium]|nr:hypothetical protein [Kiritimatiellia bacterium]
MKRPATIVGRMSAFLLSGFMSGCAMFGMVSRVPMIEVRNEAVAAQAGTDMSAAIVRAATARRWSATVTAPDVVRCRFDARSWNIVVDVRHAGSTFSIDYVSTEGLFYRPESHDIHNSYNRQVDALSQRIKREAMRAPAVVAAPAAVAAAAPAEPAVKPYVIESFAREPGDKYAYRFSLKLNDASSADLTLSRRIQADLRQSVRDDYVASSGAKDASALQIEFPEYAIKGGRVEGRAVVMTVELLEFVYDPATAQGRLAVKVNPQQYETTRQWVRSNIATLAKDKDSNILSALSGKPRFTIGREMLRDDNVLEVEFHAGE